jgi:hypothetical protein
MIPVFQTIIDQGIGNCWSACMASILEIGIDDIPNFVKEASEKRTSAESLAKKWLKASGLFLLCVPLHRGEEWLDVIDFYHLEGAYCLMSVPSQKFEGGSHAVVGQFRKCLTEGTVLNIIHDPNPNNKPYPLNVNIKRIQFIVNFNPKIV